MHISSASPVTCIQLLRPVMSVPKSTRPCHRPVNVNTEKRKKLYNLFNKLCGRDVDARGTRTLFNHWFKTCIQQLMCHVRLSWVFVDGKMTSQQVERGSGGKEAN